MALREAAHAEWAAYATHPGAELPAPHEYEVGIAPAPLIYAEAWPVVLPARPSERAEAFLAGCWAPEMQGEVVARIHWPAGGGLDAAIVAAGPPGADEVGICAGFDVAAPLHAETPPWGYELHPCGPGPIPDDRTALLGADGWRYSSRAWVFATSGAALRVLAAWGWDLSADLKSHSARAVNEEAAAWGRDPVEALGLYHVPGPNHPADPGDYEVWQLMAMHGPPPPGCKF